MVEKQCFRKKQFSFSFEILKTLPNVDEFYFSVLYIVRGKVVWSPCMMNAYLKPMLFVWRNKPMNMIHM